MADYLRQHVIGTEEDAAIVRLHSALDRAPEGSA